MDKLAMEKLGAYKLWLENAEASKAKLTHFECPSCKGEIKTLSAPENEQWDTFANCPYCRCLLFKITQGDSVKAELIQMIGTATQLK